MFASKIINGDAFTGALCGQRAMEYMEESFDNPCSPPLDLLRDGSWHFSCRAPVFGNTMKLKAATVRTVPNYTYTRFQLHSVLDPDPADKVSQPASS